MPGSHFTGVISSVTLNGDCAIVRLDKSVAGKEFAVISHRTLGRIDLMNGIGKLQKDMRVEGEGELGQEAIAAHVIRKNRLLEDS